MSHKKYLRNYSPITYEKDDIPDLFAAVSRAGMRVPTFAENPEDTPVFRREAREIHAAMNEVEEYAPLPKRPKHTQTVSPWFALASGMVVAGAVVLVFAAVAPEAVLPKGTLASLVSHFLTATVTFSR